MRAINWEQLLKEQRVPYIDRGPNVKRGEIAIQCPFCGSADPSKHMGLNLESGWWSCWRNRAQHSGKSPLRLLMKLLGIPYARARELAGLGADYVDPEGFDALAARLMGRDGGTGRKEETQRRVLSFDSSFTEIRPAGRTSHHWDYLELTRGFDSSRYDVGDLCDQYGLKAGIRGPWQDRIALPYIQDGELVTWSARAISKATIRYRDLEIEDRDGNKVSLVPPKETLFNHDAMLKGGKALVLVEGPFDALKLDFYAQVFHVRAVALSTNSISEEQSYLLQAASGLFERVIIMLDNATSLGIIDSMRMRQALHFISNVSITKVPNGAKDAGELTPGQVRAWARSA